MSDVKRAGLEHFALWQLALRSARGDIGLAKNVNGYENYVIVYLLLGSLFNCCFHFGTD